MVGERRQLGGQAPGLVAEQPGGRAAASVGVEEVDLPGAVGGQHGVDRRPGPRRTAAAGSGSTGQRAGGTGCRRWPGRSWGCRRRPSCPASTTAAGPGRVGGADDRAGVAGVADVGADRDQRAACGPSTCSSGTSRYRQTATTPGRVDGVGERGERPVVDEGPDGAAVASRSAYCSVGAPASRRPRPRSPATRPRAPSTALGPSARKSRRSERTERRLSFRASLTRVLPAVSGVAVAGHAGVVHDSGSDLGRVDVLGEGGLGGLDERVERRRRR